MTVAAAAQQRRSAADTVRFKRLAILFDAWLLQSNRESNGRIQW
jgi:hypothetical protein